MRDQLDEPISWLCSHCGRYHEGRTGTLMCAAAQRERNDEVVSLLFAGPPARKTWPAPRRGGQR